MGYKQEIQAKKGQKQKLSHNEKPNDLPPTVDWEEQERIRNTLRNSHIPQNHLTAKAHPSYTPNIGADLAIMRREGKSMRMISEETGHTQAKIRHWLSEFPEFSQQWNDCYSQYVLNVAEELVPRAEKLMEGLKLNGRTLPEKIEKRYLRAFDRLSIEVHWAASHRVPELYGDSEDGSELVIIQPQELERTVTQDVPAAVAWKEQVDAEREEAEGQLSKGDQARLPDTTGPDGVECPVSGQDDSGGIGGDKPSGGEKSSDKRRKPRRSRPLVELRKQVEDDGGSVDGNRGGGAESPASS
jgi:hypothetical protein